MRVNPNQAVLRLRKGELLFREGDKSRAMYLIKSGLVRVFIKKGTNTVDLEMARTGQIIGEMAFLDGHPRSASGEALTDCEIIEISGDAFLEALDSTPDWLKILLKTVVGRIRTANGKIKQLEANTSSIDYSDRDGSKRLQEYQYLSFDDFLKISMTLVLAACRSKGMSAAGIQVDLPTKAINLYAHSILGFGSAKIASVIGILIEVGLASNLNPGGEVYAKLTHLGALEEVLTMMNEQNQLAPELQLEVTDRGIMLLKLIRDEVNGQGHSTESVSVDLVSVQNKAKEAANSEKDVFRLDELNELVRTKIIAELKISSATEISTAVVPAEVFKFSRYLQVKVGLRTLNQQKRTVKNTVIK